MSRGYAPVAEVRMGKLNSKAPAKPSDGYAYPAIGPI
jgi:hypothetical protein